VLARKLKGFFGAPFYTFRATVTKIADYDDLFIYIECDGSEVASFNAPAAAVTLV
jgi:hypothetical protein